MYIVLFVVVFLNLRRGIFFASVNCFVLFFYLLNSLNRVRIFAEDFTKTRSCDCKIFVLFHDKKKSGHSTKFVQILSTHDFLVIC